MYYLVYWCLNFPRPKQGYRR